LRQERGQAHRPDLETLELRDFFNGGKLFPLRSQRKMRVARRQEGGLAPALTHSEALLCSCVRRFIAWPSYDGW
ncbi:MAG TPA: hypothetical protein VMZ30_04705, partial [Pyrinomonadaceae bacterium]|nr:hypothetical protein [Pyrinomonadaceae bacterium]